MKVIVTNKNESVIYNGKIYGYEESFEVDDKIGQSLIERKYVATTAGDEEKGNEAPPLREMPYTELKKMAASMGLSANGKKEELIARIEEAENAPWEEEADSGDLPNTNMPE